MQELETYDYAIVRVVPRVDRHEFVNAGVIVSCMRKKYLEARIHLDEARLVALYPGVNVDEVRAHLATIPVICKGGKEAGPIGLMSQRERFHWLVAPRSTIIQTSPAHTGKCVHPQDVLDDLMRKMVLPAD